jgi:hypothetical protein
MNYMPAVESMDRLDGGPLGPAHVAIFFGNIRSVGQIQYRYLLAVYDRATQHPVYIVASEVNSMHASHGGGSHFLCVFDGTRHLNFGDDDAWADADTFLRKALALAAAHVGLTPRDDGDSAVAGMTPGPEQNR